MPEQQPQITPQQIGLMVDIIGGLAGQYAQSLLQAPQPQVKSSPYHWKRFHIKSRPPVRPTRPEAPQPPSVEAPKVRVPPNPRPTASAQQPSRPLDSAPPQQGKTPPPQPPQNQHQILEEIKKESQHHIRPAGTELAHWIRVRQLSKSVLRQYKAAGVGSLDELADILNNRKYPENSVNLVQFHDDASPFVILSQPGENLAAGGVPAVIAGYPYSNQVHNLETAFPGIHFMTPEEAPKEIEEAASALAKPMSVKAYLAKSEEQGSSSRPTKPQQPSQPQKPKQPVQPQGQQPPITNAPQEQVKQPQLPSQQSSDPIPVQSPSSTSPSPPQPKEQEPDIWKLVPDPEDTRLYTSPSKEEQEPVPPPPPLTPEEGAQAIEEYVTYFNTNIRLQAPNYNADLPSEDQLSNARIEDFDTGSKNKLDIARVMIGDIPHFYKGTETRRAAENEILISSLAEIAEVPAPQAMRVGQLRPTGGAHRSGLEGQYPVLTSWVDGATMGEIVDGFLMHLWPTENDFLRHPKAAYILPMLEKIVRPEDIDLQILYAFQVNSRDRHLGNYMVSGDRVVTIDLEDSEIDASFISLRDIVKNDLFMIKAAGRVQEWGNKEQMASIPLSIEVAQHLVRKSYDQIKRLRATGAHPGAVQTVSDRTDVLREFIKGGDATFGGIMKAYDKLYPGAVHF